MYHNNSVALEIAGRSLTLKQTTNYPWDEVVHFAIESDEAVEFELALRIPDWCYEVQMSVNGEAQTATVDRGYLILEREWSNSDRVDLTLCDAG